MRPGALAQRETIVFQSLCLPPHVPGAAPSATANPQRALAEIARVLAPGGRLVYETPLGQLLAHPVRTSGRSLPWSSVPTLVPHRHALLFASRVKA